MLELQLISEFQGLISGLPTISTDFSTELPKAQGDSLTVFIRMKAPTSIFRPLQKSAFRNALTPTSKCENSI